MSKSGITAAIEAGTLDSRRLQNMRKLEREKEFFQRRHQEWRQMEQKQKWKRISQNQRQKRRFEESIGEDVDPQ